MALGLAYLTHFFRGRAVPALCAKIEPMGELHCSFAFLCRSKCLYSLNLIDHSSWTCSTHGSLSRLWYHTWRQVVSTKILACV